MTINHRRTVCKWIVCRRAAFEAGKRQAVVPIWRSSVVAEPSELEAATQPLVAPGSTRGPAAFAAPSHEPRGEVIPWRVGYLDRPAFPSRNKLGPGSGPGRRRGKRGRGSAGGLPLVIARSAATRQSRGDRRGPTLLAQFAEIGSLDCHAACGGSQGRTGSRNAWACASLGQQATLTGIRHGFSERRPVARRMGL
jgi:hypothetical protein